MNGVSFGDKHTYRDFSLITNEIKVGYPEVRTNYVDIPGRDGPLDLTEAAGGVTYGSRTLEFLFTLLSTNEEKKDKIVGFLLGRKMKIVLDKDKEYYYIGRCIIESFANEKNIARLSMKAICEPYKYHKKESMHSETVNGKKAIVLVNDRMRSIPNIECSAAMKVGFGGISYNLQKGIHKVLGIRLEEGYNRIELSGTGTITFTWQEGAI